MAMELALRDVVMVDGEPRIKDLILAERLGFDRPRVIRELIDRNKQELEGYGTLAPCRTASISGKGRVQEVVEYFLNEGQALLICMFSRTARAAAVRREVIRVFLDWRHGRLIEAQDRPLAPVDEPLWSGMGQRLDITSKVLDVQERAEGEHYLRAVAFLPRQGRNFRQPNFFGNKALLKLIVDLHRQVTIDTAVYLARQKFGASAPVSRTAIGRFWQRLDGARGAKFVTG